MPTLAEIYDVAAAELNLPLSSVGATDEGARPLLRSILMALGQTLAINNIELPQVRIFYDLLPYTSRVYWQVFGVTRLVVREVAYRTIPASDTSRTVTWTLTNATPSPTNPSPYAEATDVAHGLVTGDRIVVHNLLNMDDAMQGVWPVVVTGPDAYRIYGAYALGSQDLAPSTSKVTKLSSQFQPLPLASPNQVLDSSAYYTTPLAWTSGQEHLLLTSCSVNLQLQLLVSTDLDIPLPSTDPLTATQRRIILPGSLPFLGTALAGKLGASMGHARSQELLAAAYGSSVGTYDPSQVSHLRTLISALNAHDRNNDAEPIIWPKFKGARHLTFYAE